jgi:NAD(P)-dependent dehydrogenase (short-subunit alcohol dehydrogenase family)
MSNNRTLVITGASSGIGFGLVQAFLANGFNVVGNARSAEGLEKARAQLGSPATFIGVAGDIARPDTARRLIQAGIEAFGQVDVNSPGFPRDLQAS